MSPADLAITMAIGFLGGLAGGMLGIGGSIVIIPLLTLTRGPNQQLYQAACMIVNVVIAIGSAWRHAKAGSVRRDYFRWMFPAAALMVLAGVACSNLLPGDALRRVFGIFLFYTVAAETVRLIRSRRSATEADGEGGAAVSPKSSVAIGGLTGLIAGLLGVGGGTIAVPLLRSVARLPLRQAIGTSSAVMTLASTVGATAKNATIGSLAAPDGTPLTLGMSLSLAGVLAIPGLLGSQVGALLTYRLSLTKVRLAFILLLSVAGLRMLGLL